MDSLENSWQTLLENLKVRDLDLEREEKRQQQHDELRRAYAAQANSFQDWLQNTKEKIAAGRGTLEEQLDLIKMKQEEIKKKRMALKELEELSAHLETGMIFDNKYTKYSTVTLAQEWDHLSEFSRRMENTVKCQISSQNMTGVGEDDLKEFTLMFKHFDKDRSGRLDHPEFKACLRALGFDLPVPAEGEVDAVFEAILDNVDGDRDGQVRLEEYMQFMISRMTDNVKDTNELTEAFKALTDGGNKPCITGAELYAAMPQEQAKYCIDRMEKYADEEGNPVPGGLNYKDFTKNVFKPGGHATASITGF